MSAPGSTGSATGWSPGSPRRRPSCAGRAEPQGVRHPEAPFRGFPVRRSRATLAVRTEGEIVARAMWRGAIQFGLVTIPVKLYLATESKGVSFNMLHKTDLSRIQMKIYCPVDDDVISRGDTVKGFEYAPGQYVVVTDEDLESVPLKTVRSIEIEQFTERAEVDDGAVKFVKQAYYLEPDAIGRKAFYLL